MHYLISTNEQTLKPLGCFLMEENRPKETEEIVEEQALLGGKIYNMAGHKLFISALTAGLEIGFSLVVMGVLYTLFVGEVTSSVMHVLLSLGYPIGFVFVIIGRSELFTEQTALAMIPVLNKNQKVGPLFKLWGLVLLGNLVGGLLFSIFIAWFGPAKEIISVDAFVHIAKKFIDMPTELVLGSALLAGWMMGLLGWLLSSAQESVSRILLVILVTIIIGLGSLHHCIVGSVEVLSALWLSPDIGWSDYWKFIWPSVLGNTLGGALFVSTLKFAITTKANH